MPSPSPHRRFKNADERGKPPPAWPLWSVGVRLLIAPVIVFGPICGVAIAILYYVEATPSSIQTATRLREGSSWVSPGFVSTGWGPGWWGSGSKARRGGGVEGGGSQQSSPSAVWQWQ